MINMHDELDEKSFCSHFLYKSKNIFIGGADYRAFRSHVLAQSINFVYRRAQKKDFSI